MLLIQAAVFEHTKQSHWREVNTLITTTFDTMTFFLSMPCHEKFAAGLTEAKIRMPLTRGVLERTS